MMLTNLFQNEITLTLHAIPVLAITMILLGQHIKPMQTETAGENADDVIIDADFEFINNH